MERPTHADPAYLSGQCTGPGVDRDRFAQPTPRSRRGSSRRTTLPRPGPGQCRPGPTRRRPRRGPLARRSRGESVPVDLRRVGLAGGGVARPDEGRARTARLGRGLSGRLAKSRRDCVRGRRWRLLEPVAGLGPRPARRPGRARFRAHLLGQQRGTFSRFRREQRRRAQVPVRPEPRHQHLVEFQRRLHGQ